MVIFCFCWFLILYGLAFILGKDKDIFSPIKFVSLKYGLLNLIFILYICFNPAAFSKRILRACNVTLNEAFLQYTVVQTIAFVSLIIGIMVFKKKDGAPHVPDLKKYNYYRLKILAVVLFSIGCAAYFIFLHRIGGLSYLLTNLDKRIQLQGGQYILNLLPVLVISCLLMFVCVKIKNKTSDKILLGVFIIGTLAIYNSFGSRENSLIFIVALIATGNYVINKLKFNRKNIALLGVLAGELTFYILIIPTIRNASDVNYVKQNHVTMSMKGFVYNLSYTYIDVFAANYFNNDNAWYLAGYFAPVTTLFASPEEKKMIPQVDQGVYFNSIVLFKKDYRPPMPRNELSKTSWPTENFGFAYSNFLIPGIIVFFFLQGMVFAYAHRILKNDIYNPITIFFYVLIIFTFNFSSLRIASFIKITPLIYIIYIIYNRLVKSENRLESLKVKV